LKRFEKEINNHLIFVDFEKKITVKDLLEKPAVPTAEVGLISINGVAVDKNYVLGPDDVVSIYPLIGGG